MRTCGRTWRPPFVAIAEEFGFWIEELAIESDHVHVFLEFPPKYAIARVVGILKSISASRTFQQFPGCAGSTGPASCGRTATPCARLAIA